MSGGGTPTTCVPNVTISTNVQNIRAKRNAAIDLLTDAGLAPDVAAAVAAWTQAEDDALANLRTYYTGAATEIGGTCHRLPPP